MEDLAGGSLEPKRSKGSVSRVMSVLASRQMSLSPKDSMDMDAAC